MAAQITFDQVGLAAGLPGRARTDGLSNGAVVTVTNASGNPCRCEFWWYPPDDTTVAASLMQVAPNQWEFQPTADRPGEYAIRMIEDEGGLNETEDIKIFGVRYPTTGLLLTALNSRGDVTVNRASSLAHKNDAAASSFNNEPLPDDATVDYANWWQQQRELFEALEDSVSRLEVIETVVNNNPASNVQWPTYVPTVTDPTADLTFTRYTHQRPIQLVAPGLRDRIDDFEHPNAFNDYTESTNGVGAVTTTYPAGTLQAAGTGNFNRYYRSRTPLSCPYYAVTMQVDVIGTGTTPNRTLTGIMVDFDNFVMLRRDFNGNTLILQERVGGSTTDRFTVAIPAATAPYSIGFVITGNQAHGFYNAGRGWVWVASATLSSLDYRDPAVYSTYRAGFAVASNGSTTWNIGKFECGVFGQLGMRDPYIVRHKNGAPFVVNGRMYISATVMPTGGNFHHCGIYALDLSTFQLEKTAVVLWRRASDGLDLGHIAGCFLFDEDLQQWRVFCSTWGNFPFGGGNDLELRHGLYSGQLLRGVHIITDHDVLPVSQDASFDVYDIDLMFDSDAELWRVAYTRLSGGLSRATLDTSPDLVSFTNLILDTNTGYEGSRVQQIGDDLYALFSSTSNTRVYNATSGSFIGNLGWTLPGSTRPPHPAIFPRMHNGMTEWWILSFDNFTYQVGGGSSEHATIVLERCDPSEFEVGFIFPLYGQ